jgi:eukaryotic-like serine/threonine-protein kinase
VRRDETPRSGTVLDGRYRLVRRLGSGGMASVWEAQDERLGRPVAVKILSDTLANEEDYRRRFEREARVAAGLNHAGLVGIHDFGVEADAQRPYLVMELVLGTTLSDRIADGTVGELDLLALSRALLDALEHIHSAGVVHRDLKPGNVLIGADGRIRLTDFGIAQPKDATAITQAGQVIGTLDYMAPEVRRGEPATPSSDLYSLGILLGECGGSGDPALSALIRSLTAPDPRDRPSSAAASRELLDRTATTAPAIPTAPTRPVAPTAPTRRLRRSRWPYAAVAALALLGLALGLALGSGGDESPSPSPPFESGQPAEGNQGSQGEARQTASPPAAAQPQPETDEAISCSAIEEQKKAIEEQKKAAEESAGDDQAAKEAIKQQFEQQKAALEERAKECDGGEGGDGGED